MGRGCEEDAGWQQLAGHGVLEKGVMLGAGRRHNGSRWLGCPLLLFFFVGFSFAREVLKIGGLRGWGIKLAGRGVLEKGVMLVAGEEDMKRNRNFFLSASLLF